MRSRFIGCLIISLLAFTSVKSQDVAAKQIAADTVKFNHVARVSNSTTDSIVIVKAVFYFYNTQPLTADLHVNYHSFKFTVTGGPESKNIDSIYALIYSGTFHINHEDIAGQLIIVNDFKNGQRSIYLFIGEKTKYLFFNL